MDMGGLIVGLVIGAAASGVAALLWARRRDAALIEARQRADLLDAQAQRLNGEIESARAAQREVNERRESAERSVAAMQEKLAARERQLAEQMQFVQQVEQRFAELSAVALKANSQQVLNLAGERLGPLKELLEKQGAAVTALETKREAAYATLDQKIQQIAASHEKLGAETGRLVSALRRPEQRGRWGEVQLRNVVELAGMSEHCDFDCQVSTWNGEASLRPDMVVNLPGGGVIPVDSKVALDGYLDAIQEGSDRDTQLKRHARHVQEHVTKLADKKYWECFARTPGVVVMFMPLESALVAALEAEPELHAKAMARQVLIATPTLLVALLRAVAYGWQQEAQAKNAREIAMVGRELYERLAKFVGHFERVGAQIASAAETYNKAIGSLESRVLPSARDLKRLHATTEQEIAAPAPVEIEVRPITAAELKSADDTARIA